MLELRDGRLLESSFDRTMKVWDATKTNCLVTLPYGHRDIVTCLVELKDGRIASGSFDKTFRLWSF